MHFMDRFVVVPVMLVVLFEGCVTLRILRDKTALFEHRGK
jgi:hypothetical protein